MGTLGQDNAKYVLTTPVGNAGSGLATPAHEWGGGENANCVGEGI